MGSDSQLSPAVPTMERSGEGDGLGKPLFDSKGDAHKNSDLVVSEEKIVNSLVETTDSGIEGTRRASGEGDARPWWKWNILTERKATIFEEKSPEAIQDGGAVTTFDSMGDAGTNTRVEESLDYKVANESGNLQTSAVAEASAIVDHNTQESRSPEDERLPSQKKPVKNDDSVDDSDSVLFEANTGTDSKASNSEDLDYNKSLELLGDDASKTEAEATEGRPTSETAAVSSEKHNSYVKPLAPPADATDENRQRVHSSEGSSLGSLCVPGPSSPVAARAKTLIHDLGEGEVEPNETRNLLVLISIGLDGFDRAQASNQRKALRMLKANGIPYETVDGGDPEHQELRNGLFEVAGITNVAYPQMFFVGEGYIRYFGDYSKLEEVNEASAMDESILMNNPDIETWDRVFRSTDDSEGIERESTVSNSDDEWSEIRRRVVENEVSDDSIESNPKRKILGDEPLSDTEPMDDYMGRQIDDSQSEEGQSAMSHKKDMAQELPTDDHDVNEYEKEYYDGESIATGEKEKEGEGASEESHCYIEGSPSEVSSVTMVTFDDNPPQRLQGSEWGSDKEKKQEKVTTKGLYENEALQDLLESITDLRSAFDASPKQRSSSGTGRIVSSGIENESDSEPKEGSIEESTNLVASVVIGFEDILCALLRVSDELVLSSSFRAETSVRKVINVEALLNVISHTKSIYTAFLDMRPSLLELHSEGGMLQGTDEGACLKRTIKLAAIVTSLVEQVNARQEWNAMVATCYITMLELLAFTATELKCMTDGDEEAWELSPKLRTAWTASEHLEQLQMLEDRPTEVGYLFKLIAMDVISRIDQWAPSEDDLRFICGYESEPNIEVSGSGDFAEVPSFVSEIVGRIIGDPLPRDAIVSRVVKCLLATADIFGVQSMSDASESKSATSGSSLSIRGNIIAISSVSEEGHSHESLGMSGMGKTTIAALVALRKEVQNEYSGGTVWVNVGDRGESGYSYDEYCETLLSVCDQLALRQRPVFPVQLNVPGESHAEQDRRKSKLMLDAREMVGGLLRDRKGNVLVILDDVWRDRDLDLFRFRWKKKRLCDILVTTRVQRLMAFDRVLVDVLSVNEGVRLLMTESGQRPDHVLAKSVEARAIVQECSSHPIAIKVVARSLGFKYAFSGVANRFEEAQQDISRALERLSVPSGKSASTISEDSMLFEMMNHSLAPTIEGKETKIIKLYFAAFALVFCKDHPNAHTIPSEAADELFQSILQRTEKRNRKKGEKNFKNAVQLMPKALTALGIIQTGTFDGTNRTMMVTHNLYLEYAEYLLTNKGGLGDLTDDAERSFNKAFSSAYQKLMVGDRSWNERDPSEGQKYALEYLVLHMIRADMIPEAIAILKDEKFSRGRLIAMGLAKGAKRHVHDCEAIFNIMFNSKTRSSVDGRDFMTQSYIIMGACVQFHLSESKSDEFIYSDAFHARSAMGFSLVERKIWASAVPHYDASYELLEKAVGDKEVLAAVLFTRALVLIETNQNKRAMESLDECLVALVSHVGENGALVAQTICKKGDLYATMGDHSAAEQNYRRGLEIMQAGSDKSHVGIGNAYRAMAQVHSERGELEQSLKLYDEALRSKKMEVDPNNEDLAALYREIGSAYFEQGNIENAIPMLQEALHLMEAIAPMKETEADLLSVRAMANICRGEREGGLKCFTQALGILQSKAGPTKEEKKKIATILNSIGCERLALGEHRKAFQAFEEALRVLKERDGPAGGFAYVLVATILANMASTYETRGRYGSSLRCLEDCLRIQRLRLGDSDAVASTLTRIGNLCRDHGDFKRSEAAYEDALLLLRSLHGPHHPAVASVLHEMGDLMDDVSQYDEAMDCFGACLDVRRKTLGPDHRDVADTLHSMGYVLHNRGDHVGAIKRFEDALLIRRAAFGRDHAIVGDSLNVMGFVEAKRDRHGPALDLLREALSIRRRQEGGGNPEKVADTLTNMGRSNQELGERGAAIRCYDECLRLRRAVADTGGPPKVDEKVAVALLALGEAYGDARETGPALRCHREALALLRALHGPSDDRVAAVLLRMGMLELATGNAGRGRALLEDFRRIRRSNRTEASIDYVNAMVVLGHARGAQSDTDGARKAWSEASGIFNSMGLAKDNPRMGRTITGLLGGVDGGDPGTSADAGLIGVGGLKLGERLRVGMGVGGSKRLVIE